MMDFSTLDDMDLLQFVSDDERRAEFLTASAELLDTCVSVMSAETLHSISFRPERGGIVSTFKVVLLGERDGLYLGLRTDSRCFVELDPTEGYWAARELGTAIDALAFGWSQPGEYLENLDELIKRKSGPQPEEKSEPAPPKLATVLYFYGEKKS